MEKGLTSYVLNYLLSTCFDSKADMARQLDMSKRALQRVMNEPQLSKGGSVALVKALCYCARHHVPVDPILREYAAHDTDHQKDFIYDPSTINLAAYTRLTRHTSARTAWSGATHGTERQDLWKASATLRGWRGASAGRSPHYTQKAGTSYDL